MALWRGERLVRIMVVRDDSAGERRLLSKDPANGRPSFGDISTSHGRNILVGTRSEKGDGADRIVLARSLEVIVAVVIVLIGVLGWKLIIVDVWLAETDEQSISVAHVTAKTH